MAMYEELRKVRDWADEKIASCQEPPWAWYQLMKLREAADAILAGAAQLTDSPQSGSHLAERPRLVVSNAPRDSVPPRPPDDPVQLPT